ncbi:MAG: hypothetical protein ACJA0Y_001060 [Maricaulis maris]|jgi:hypothetical protein
MRAMSAVQDDVTGVVHGPDIDHVSSRVFREPSQVSFVVFAEQLHSPLRIAMGFWLGRPRFKPF